MFFSLLKVRFFSKADKIIYLEMLVQLGSTIASMVTCISSKMPPQTGDNIKPFVFELSHQHKTNVHRMGPGTALIDHMEN